MLDALAHALGSTTGSGGGGPAEVLGGFGWLLGYVVTVVLLWPVFAKAGIPGWGALIPIYNLYVLVKIAGHAGWLVLLFFLPIANIVAAVFVSLGVGRAFGRSTLFSVLLLLLLPVVGFAVIGYGGSRYIGAGGDPERRIA